MSWDTDFAQLFSHTIQLAPWDGTYDGNGRPQYGADVSYAARISGKILALRHAQNEEPQPLFDVWFRAPATTKITVNDRLTLPDEAAVNENRNPSIYAIARVTDDDGQHHVKLQCGWTYHRQGQ